MASANGNNPQGSSQEMPEPRATRDPFNSGTSDSVAQQLNGVVPGVTPGLNFEGQSAQDTRNIFGFAFVPPDTNGAAGASQYVQIVNVTIAIYDKNTGARVMGPAAIHTLWTGFGGPCEFDTPDGGDPVVLYDHLANRWLVTQLQFNSTFTQNEQCVAVSTTSDATGSYNRYEFDFGANFPDYPKYGIWPDAYYNTANVFPAHSFAGAEACAFDRNAMLSGLAAVLMQCVFAVCMLAVVVVGLLVMIQAISLEELGHAIGRALLGALAVFIALCVMKSLLLPILSSWIVGLKQMIGWLVIVVVAIIAAVLLLRLLISRFQEWLSRKNSHNGGDYE